MKTTIKQLLSVQQSLALIQSRDLPSRTSYWLARLASKIKSPLKDYDKQRVALVKKYGEQKDNAVNVLPDKQKDFWDELSPIQDAEENIDFNPLKVSDFDGLNLPVDFFIGMGEFIVE